MTHIYEDGRRYDLLFDEGPVAFWLDQARAAGRSVLELGYGTGKLAIPLAQAGFDVCGIDLSEPMLDYGKVKAKTLGVTLTLLNADMRDFDLQHTFELIMLPSNNLSHLYNLADFHRCMGCVKRHLTPSGRLVIDVFVPGLRILLDEEEYLLSEYDDPDGVGRKQIFARSHYEFDTQIRRTRTYEKSTTDGPEGTLDLKMYFPQELNALLHAAGFRWERFGGYDGEPFTSASVKQIVVAYMV